MLVIGTTNTETRFLNESELPACARLNRRGQASSSSSTSSVPMEEDDVALQEAILKSQTNS